MYSSFDFFFFNLNLVTFFLFKDVKFCLSFPPLMTRCILDSGLQILEVFFFFKDVKEVFFLQDLMFLYHNQVLSFVSLAGSSLWLFDVVFVCHDMIG